MIRFASQAITSFSTIPLRIGIWIGSLTSILAFLELIYIATRYLQGYTVQGWASTAGLLSLLFGILFIMLGIIGTYLASIHHALQRRPKFIISEAINIDNEPMYHLE